MFTGTRRRRGPVRRHHRSPKLAEYGPYPRVENPQRYVLTIRHRAAAGRYQCGRDHHRTVDVPFEFEELPDNLETSVILKVGDNISTDTIIRQATRFCRSEATSRQ
jgi:hypothetical protein